MMTCTTTQRVPTLCVPVSTYTTSVGVTPTPMFVPKRYAPPAMGRIWLAVFWNFGSSGYGTSTQTSTIEWPE